MNALIVIGLCALSANAQFFSGVHPYSAYNPNFLHSGAFSHAVAAPISYAAAPVSYTTAAVAPAFVAPTTRTSQFHAQDEFGQYNFGYAGGPSSRNEVRDVFGGVRGSYNYIDANGEIQTTNYVADALGFRVAATNLPVAPKAEDAPVLASPEPVMETSEVAAARAALEKVYAEAAAAIAAAPESRKKRSAHFISGVHPYSAYNPTFLHSGAFSHAVAAPISYAAAPVSYTTAAVAPAFVAPTTRTSQFHAQDEFGQYNFGYAGGPSSRNEVRDVFGGVRGSYNYIDANGEIQTTSYVADALGFRVAATNLPVAPKAEDAPVLASPEPVMETSEVAAARAAHQKAFDEAAAAAAAAPDSRKKRSVGSVAIHSAVSPLNFAYGFNSVHPYNFPAVGSAVRFAGAPAVTYAAGPALAPAAVRYAGYAGHAVAPAAAVTYNAAAPAIAATHDATLLRVENNPGHAVSYRVY